MAAPTWTTGEVLTSSDVNEWFVPIAAVKTSDQQVSSSTLANDSELVITIGADKYYQFDMYIEYEGGTSGSSDMKWTFTLPGSTTLHYTAFFVGTGGSVVTNPNLIYASDTKAAETDGTTRMGVIFSGIIWGSSSGDVQFRFARNSGSGTGPTVHKGSWMTARRIA